MPRAANPATLPGAQEMLSAVRNEGARLRERYADDPVAFAETLGIQLPRKPVFVMLERGVITLEEAKERFGDDEGELTPGIRELVEEVCTLQVRSAVAVANRGGGKSLSVAFIEMFLTFLKDFDALNLGGSQLQADAVYSYIEGFIESTKELSSLVKGEMLASETMTKAGAWIRVLTASSKSVRSPHAGGRRRIPNTNPTRFRDAGGLLVIDEEAEAEPAIVKAALPTINTARPSVNVRCSTFHNIAGTFADVVDNAEEMGYRKYAWNIFDVCEQCDCGPDGCESDEKCFREDHWEEYTDPDTHLAGKRLLHRAYCGGRSRYADGWVPMEEITALWKRGKRNHASFEVEAMGSRPTSAGFVIKDKRAYKDNRTDTLAQQLYKQGWPITVCVDWGTVAAGVSVWQEWSRDRHVLLHADLNEEAGTSQILGVVMGYRERYVLEFTEVAADIGGGGNYLNKSLRDEYGITTRDVNFGEEKEAAVAAWNILNEANKIIYPKEFTDFHDQASHWKRKNGRIEKKNDHLCDSSVCYFAKFIDRLGTTHLRAMPVSFIAVAGHDKLSEQRATAAAGQTDFRAPILRSFGSR